MWIWTARFQDLQCQHAVSEFTRENRFDHGAYIALIMRGKGWIEAASCFQHRIKKGKHHRYYNGQYLRKKHVQRCDNHLGDQLIQRLRKKKKLVRTQMVLFSLKCLSGHGTQHQFRHLSNHAAISNF